MSKQKINEHIITDATMHMRKVQYAMRNEQNKLLESIKLLAEDPKYAELTFDNISSETKKIFESEKFSVENLIKQFQQTKKKDLLHISVLGPIS